MNLKSVFQSQSTRPRVAVATQVDSPQQPRVDVVVKDAKAKASTLLAQLSQGKPSGPNETKVNAQEMPRKERLSRPQQVPPARQNASLEAFRLQILNQLTSLEARQQNEGPPTDNDGPGSSDGNSVERVSVSTEPEHMLTGVLNAVTEVSYMSRVSLLVHGHST